MQGILCTQCRTEIVAKSEIDNYSVGETISCPECDATFDILSLNPISLQVQLGADDEDEFDEEEDEDFDDDDDEEYDYSNS